MPRYTAAPNTASPRSHSFTAACWIAALGESDPDLRARAASQGVFDEASYLELEPRLTLSLRGALGVARFELLTGGPMRVENALDLLSFAPPWLLELPIQVLQLGTRATNIMRDYAIDTLRMLSGYREHELRSMPRMGSSSMLELAQKVVALFDGGPSQRRVADHLLQQEDAWLTQLPLLAPRLALQAEAAGIVDTATYRMLEHRLHPELRAALGMARFEYDAQGPVDAATILDKLKHGPPWLLRIPVRLLHLSVRPSRCLAEHRIETLDDLAALGEAPLWQMRRMGRTSIEEIGAAVAALFRHGPSTGEVADFLASGRDDWLITLRWSNPDLTAAADAAGITDEDSYLAREHTVSADLRGQLGQARFWHYAKTGPAPGNMLRHLRHLPAWMLPLPIVRLGLTPKAASALQRPGHKTVGDLLPLGEQIADLDRMGQIHVDDFTTRLVQVMEQGPAHPDMATLLDFFCHADHSQAARQVAEAQYPPPSLARMVVASLQVLPTEEARVLRLRAGISGPARSLTECVALMGLSYDLVRRHERNLLQGYRPELAWVEEAASRLHRLRERRCEPLPVTALPALDNWFDGVPDLTALLDYAMGHLRRPELHVVSIEGSCYLTEIGQGVWDQALQSARHMVEQAVVRRPTRARLVSQLEAILPSRARELNGLLLRQTLGPAHFAPYYGLHEEPVLVSYGVTKEARLMAVLSSAPHALHEDEIVVRLREDHQVETNGRWVAARAGVVGLTLGPRTYGIARHIPLSAEEQQIVVDTATELLREGRQIQSLEVALCVRQRHAAMAERADKYVVHSTLLRDGRLRHLGRMIWSAAPGTENGTHGRVHLLLTVETLIEQHGAPMRGAAIMEQIRNRRGIASTFQIHEKGRLVRVGENLWGLIDRDLPFPIEHLPAIADATVRAVEARGKGIHVSEINHALVAQGLDCVRSLEPTLLMSLAHRDKRCAVDRGNYIYLRHWNGSGRFTPQQAVRQMLEDPSMHDRPTSAYRQAAEAMLERPVATPSLENALRTAGMRFDFDARVWRKREEESGTADSPGEAANATEPAAEAIDG